MPPPPTSNCDAVTAARPWIEQGCELAERGDFAGARRALTRAVSLDPTAPEIHARLADTCAQLGDWLAAAAAWHRVLVIKPDLPSALTGLASASFELGDFASAEINLVRAVEVCPGQSELHFNLGYYYAALGRTPPAITSFLRALELEPSHAAARWNLALTMLKSGNFETGAVAYDVRWETELQGKQRPFAVPRWNGAPLAQGRLLLWGEQGIGDEIMFAGLIPQAASGNPCVVETASRLVPLFQRSFPGIDVLSRTNPPLSALRSPDIVAQLPFGSLPGLLWPAATVPEAPVPYLRADREMVSEMRTRLAELGPGQKIGIAWRGGHPASGRIRRIPAAAWKPLCNHADVLTVSLQHGATAQEIAGLAAACGRAPAVLAEVDPLEDMDRFAALIAALDAVISVDNSTVHLAGALGVPTGVLLAIESDWRWGNAGVPCPWYRTVDRIRQQKPHDWTQPMAEAMARFVPA